METIGKKGAEQKTEPAASRKQYQRKKKQRRKLPGTGRKTRGYGKLEHCTGTVQEWLKAMKQWP